MNFEFTVYKNSKEYIKNLIEINGFFDETSYSNLNKINFLMYDSFNAGISKMSYWPIMSMSIIIFLLGFLGLIFNIGRLLIYIMCLELCTFAAIIRLQGVSFWLLNYNVGGPVFILLLMIVAAGEMAIVLSLFVSIHNYKIKSNLLNSSQVLKDNLLK